MVAMPKRKRLLKRKTIWFLLAIVSLLIWLIVYWFSNINGIVVRMAEARANQLAVKALNDAISEVMDSSVTYGDLVQVSVDAQGKISMLQANTLLMNNLASQAALAAQRNLGELADQGIELPVGSALGIELFEGAGPRIRVSVVPVGSVSTKFVTAFEDAGINQTRHEISVEATVLMRIIVPAGAESVLVRAYMPIAESIIVGEVPDTYVQLTSPEDALNLVP